MSGPRVTPAKDHGRNLSNQTIPAQQQHSAFDQEVVLPPAVPVAEREPQIAKITPLATEDVDHDAPAGDEHIRNVIAADDAVESALSYTHEPREVPTESLIQLAQASQTSDSSAASLLEGLSTHQMTALSAALGVAFGFAVNSSGGSASGSSSGFPRGSSNDSTPPVASNFTFTTKAVGATSTEAGTVAVYDGDALISGLSTASLIKTTTVGAQPTVVRAILKVADDAGNFALATRNVALGTSAGESISGITSDDEAIYGFGGNDSLSGGAGNDYLIGGAGNDSLSGGDGDDVFVYDVFSFEDGLREDTLRDDTVSGGNGTDTIKFTSAISAFSQNFNNLGGVTSVEQVELFGASSINLGSSTIAAGIRTIITGDDDTALRYDSSANVTFTVDASNLADGRTLTLSQFGSSAYVGAWFEVVNLKGDLNASGLTGGISVTASSGAGFSVSVTAGNGSDSITGSAGNDTIIGNNGNDTIMGGVGNDLIDGGAGTDTYIYTAATDSTVNNTASPKTGFDIFFQPTSGDAFDFGTAIDSVRVSAVVSAISSENPANQNGDSLIAALNALFQANDDDVANREAMVIRFQNGDQYLVADLDSSQSITSADNIIFMPGTITLTLSGGGDVLVSVA